MSQADMRLDNAPSLGGEDRDLLSGHEPVLGGDRSQNADPDLLRKLLDHEKEAWQRTITEILDMGKSRVYAYALVKIIAAGERHRSHPDGYTVEQRISATRALEAFGSDVSIQALVDLLGDRAWWLGQYAISALVAIGLPVVDPVTKALQSRNAIVRRRAADVLGEVGDRRITPDLIKLLETDWVIWVKIRAARALGLLRDRRAVEALRSASCSSDPALQREAESALEAMDETPLEVQRI